MRIEIVIFFIIISKSLSAQHSLRKMPYPINTDVYEEICPILSFDERELYFTRSGSPDFDKTIVENGINLYDSLDLEAYHQKLTSIFTQLTGSVEDSIHASFNQDIWYSDYYEGEVFNIFHPTHPLNNALPNSICSHYGEEDAYVLVNQFEKEGGTKEGFSYTKKIDDITFSFPEPIHINGFNMTGSEVNISMSLDKQYIIMAMGGQDTYGDQDLYLSILGTDGTYSKPIHLSDKINSPYREATPFFSQDKKFLYFASDRPGGVGGMDIYVSKRLDNNYKEWSTPIPLGRPVNSPSEDSHPYITVDQKTILFTSDRDGSSDIFLAKLIRDTIIVPIQVNLIAVKGEDRVISPADLYWSEAYENKYDGFFKTRDGYFTYIFDENKPLEFKAENRGYISDVYLLDPQELQDQGIRSIDLTLHMQKGEGRIPEFKRPVPRDQKGVVYVDLYTKEDTTSQEERQSKLDDDDFIPLELYSTVVLKNIMFEKAKPNVLPVSFPSLQKLAKTLIRRTDAVIQIEGHTDNVGDQQALMNLSLERANAIRKYLIDQGVSPSQIKTKGFGNTRPITRNRNEKERSQNRRVEIRVLKQKKESP